MKDVVYEGYYYAEIDKKNNLGYNYIFYIIRTDTGSFILDVKKIKIKIGYKDEENDVMSSEFFKFNTFDECVDAAVKYIDNTIKEKNNA